MVANLGSDRLFLVVNASRKDDDFTHLSADLPAGVRLAVMEDRALLALQGPRRGGAGAAGAGCGEAAVPGRRRDRYRRHSLPGLPLRLYRRGRVRDFASGGPRRGIRRPLAGAAGSGAGRPWRARFAAAGSRAVPVRQRHRRTHLAGRGRPDLGDRQTPPRGMGFSGRDGHPRPVGGRHVTRLRVGIRPEAARRHARSPTSSRTTAPRRVSSPLAGSRRR